MSKKNLNPEGRTKFILFFVCLVVCIYILQLLNLQVFNDDYKTFADSNAFLKRTRFPSRGILYDRNGELLVYNKPAYDLMFVMKEIQPFDTLLFCDILNISYDFFVKRIADIKDRRMNPGYSAYTPQVFLKQLSTENYGKLQELLYLFPGFYTQHRTDREYKYPNAAHILGYISEADKNNIKDDEYYTKGDYIGKAGVEGSYEKYLRGEKGVEILLRDARGRIKGRYENGEYDLDPVSGKNLTLSIDINLQAFAEQLLQNKVGSITMIEPATGEILCMASSPTYDPSTLVGRQFTDSYLNLQNDPRKPLINRALSGRYPPGSTFKPAQSLVFLEEGIINPLTAYSCHGGFPLNKGRPACHAHGSPLSLIPALATSCNAYFCWGLKGMLENRKYGTKNAAFDTWKDRMVSQGFGYRLGVDLAGEQKGFIPNSKSYDNIYNKRGGSWNAFTIISISIGQGEVAAGPLQICNLAATIANRGYFYTPHVVKSVQDVELDTMFTHRRYTGIRKENYDVVADGMAMAVNAGTCRRAAISEYQICGKTGTAENAGKDHSIFMGFAPKDNPQVAIAVYIENGGFGATYAVPIGKLMFQKFLLGEIPESDKGLENEMKNTVILPHVSLPKN